MIHKYLVRPCHNFNRSTYEVMIANQFEEDKESKKRSSTDASLKQRVEYEFNDEDDEETSSEGCGCDRYVSGDFNWGEVIAHSETGIVSKKSEGADDCMSDFFFCLYDDDAEKDKVKNVLNAVFLNPVFEKTVYRSSKQISRHYDIPSFAILIQHPVFDLADGEAYCRGMCRFDEYEPDRDLVHSGFGFEKVDCERSALQIFHSVAALFCDFKIKEAEVNGTADKETKRNWLIELHSHIIVAKEYAWIRPGRKAMGYWTSLFKVVDEVLVARSEELKSLEYDESDLYAVGNLDEKYFEKIMEAKGM